MPKSLAELNQEDLAEIERLAGLCFTPWEIALALELEPGELNAYCDTDLMLNADSGAFKAYWSGRMQTEADLRESIKKMADAGSVPAQSMMLDLLKQSKMKMIDR